jgi:hypothetical protein
MTKYAIAYGNIVDGYKFIGPFDDFEDCEEYAQKYVRNRDYNIIEFDIPIDPYNIR